MEGNYVSFSNLERNLREFNGLLGELVNTNKGLDATIKELKNLYNVFSNSLEQVLMPEVSPDKIAVQRLYNLFTRTHELFDEVMVSFDDGRLKDFPDEEKEDFVEICQQIVPLIQDELSFYELDALDEEQQKALEHLIDLISNACPCEVCYSFDSSSGFEIWQNILSLENDVQEGLVSNIKALFSDDGRLYILSKNDENFVFSGYSFSEGTVRTLTENEALEAAEHFKSKFSGASVAVGPEV